MSEKIRVRYNENDINRMESLLKSNSLNTVCVEASCPNIGECFKNHTATFMIMGSMCTRNCHFCDVRTGIPEAIDENEPANIAKTVRELGLKHVVITCVTRDDLPDGGAKHFARCVDEIRNASEDISVELLISDLKGDHSSIDIVVDSNPNVINHNLETVPSLYSRVRPQARYERSLDVLRYVKEKNPRIITKTGIMVGLGETIDEISTVLRDSRKNNVDIFTIGQYLRPSDKHLPVEKYYTAEDYALLKEIGESYGLRMIVGPLVRSSYNALNAVADML